MSSSHKTPRKPVPAPSLASQELVDPVWILKATVVVIAVAAVCAYAAICALFWHGQWQIVLSPSRTLSFTPAALGLAFEEVRFGPDEGGQPGLIGWWISASAPTPSTVLLLHGSSGSMSNVLTQARLLHDTGLNVFLFDYRGYGKSQGAHPTQQQMEQDTEAAMKYLNALRHVPTDNVIAFGEGLGAALATRFCAEHKEVKALILENADGDVETRAALDTRSRMVPMSLLFNQRFPLADPLHVLTTPKLLISYTKSAAPPVIYARAADPKLTVEIGSPQDTAAISATLRRFLDSYVTRQPSVLVPQRP